MQKIATLLLLTALAHSAGAETLSDYLDEAAANNPQLAATYNQWQASSEQIPQQKALPDPVISYAYYLEEIETRVGPQEQRFGITQTFPAFGKRGIKESAATQSAAAASERYRKARLDLNTQVTRAYSELWFLQQSIDITRAQIQLLNQLEYVARTQYQNGGAMTPLSQMQIELALLENQLRSLEDQRKPLTIQLNALLNRPADSILPLPAPLPFDTLKAKAEPLFAELRENSPELAELGYTVKRAKQLQQLAHRNAWPDLTIGLQYIDTSDAAMPVADSGKDPLIATISINLPLWSGKNSAHRRETGYRTLAAELSLENRARTLQADIQRTLFKLRDAERTISLYQDGLIPKAEQMRAVTKRAYESDQLDFDQVINAERQLLEFQLTLARARADHLQQRAQLSQQSGLDFLTGATHETD